MFAYSLIRRPTTQILQFSNEKHMWSFMIVFHKVLYSRYYVSHHCIFGSAFSFSQCPVLHFLHCMKFALEVTRLFKKRRLRQISAKNVSTVLKHGLSATAELLVIIIKQIFIDTHQTRAVHKNWYRQDRIAHNGKHKNTLKDVITKCGSVLACAKI